jgi:KUP system potassium uptake protein
MESSIQFIEAPLRPTKSNVVQSVGGVVPLRSRSRSRGRQSSYEDQKARELEIGEDEDAGLRDARDFKAAQVRGNSPMY